MQGFHQGHIIFYMKSKGWQSMMLVVTRYFAHISPKRNECVPWKGPFPKGKLVFQRKQFYSSHQASFFRGNSLGFRGSLKVFSFRIRLTPPVDVAKNLPVDVVFLSGFSRFRDAEVVNNREPFSCSAVVEKRCCVGHLKRHWECAVTRWAPNGFL